MKWLDTNYTFITDIIKGGEWEIEWNKGFRITRYDDINNIQGSRIIKIW